jgi:hypothetical protein
MTGIVGTSAEKCGTGGVVQEEDKIEVGLRAVSKFPVVTALR